MLYFKYLRWLDSSRRGCRWRRSRTSWTTAYTNNYRCPIYYHSVRLWLFTLLLFLLILLLLLLLHLLFRLRTRMALAWESEKRET
jgi:hypothetical protein